MILSTSTLIKRTLRIPRAPLDFILSDRETAGTGEEMTRRFDIALMSMGFKLSTEALQYFSVQQAELVNSLAVSTLAAVRELVGDHVQHNTYFIDFPKNVPDTLEFWVACLREAVTGIAVGERFSYVQLHDVVSESAINLLMLPTYGKYQHIYEEMLGRHDEFMPNLKDRVTILHLGELPIEEMGRLFETLAGTATPPSPADRELLKHLTQQLAVGYDRAISFELPGRETKAFVNAAIMEWAQPRHLNAPPLALVQVNTITDVLRAVDVLSGGDGTLEKRAPAASRMPRVTLGELEVKPFAEALSSLNPAPVKANRTKLGSLTRPQRRMVMAALDKIIAGNQNALVDVYRHRQAWRRLGEGIHPHEFRRAYPEAIRVFAVARGDLVLRSLAGLVEQAFAIGDVLSAAHLLQNEPGLFARQLDRVLREVSRVYPAATMNVLRWFSRVTPLISGRVLLSLIEHFRNRVDNTLPRLFVNRAGRAFVTPDTRIPLSPALIGQVEDVINQELMTRLDKMVDGAGGPLLAEDGSRVKPWIVTGRDIGQIALPMSNKGTAAGLDALPRGSTCQLDDQDTLRFFIYWRERAHTTDFDLSIQLLDESFDDAGSVSWRYLRRDDGTIVHSGDIVTSANGATEMINVRLRDLSPDVKYLIPQVLVYSGEKFGTGPDDEEGVAESLFGYMTLDDDQRGAPFDPRTVRTRLDMRGQGNVAIPMVFERVGERWQAKTLNLFMRGTPFMNVVESTRMTAGLQAQAAIRHRHLLVWDVVTLLGMTGYTIWGESALPIALKKDQPVLYLGQQKPDAELPPGSRVITLENLTELIPE